MKIRIETPIEDHYASYECAAWWQDSASETGEFELVLNTKEPHWVYVVSFPAKVTKDNFQSLFGGNPCGRAYDEKQNTGKPTSFKRSFEVDAFVTDSRFIVGKDNIDEVCDIAEQGLTKLYQFYRNWLMEGLSNHETPPEFVGDRVSYPAAKLAEVSKRFQAVKTFRAWHRNTWKYQADQPDSKWVQELNWFSEKRA